MFHLLLAGSPADWADDAVRDLTERYGDLVAAHLLTRQPQLGALHDGQGDAHRLFALSRRNRAGLILVQPDGHIAYRADGLDVTGLKNHLTHYRSPGNARP